MLAFRRWQVVGARLRTVFLLAGAVVGVLLWAPLGWSAVPDLVADIGADAVPAGSNPAEVTPLGAMTLLTATGPMGNELYTSDGTAAGTSVLLDIVPGPASSSPQELTRIGTEVFFTAKDDEAGRELWKTDGTPGGTVRVADIHPTGDASPFFLMDVGGVLYFVADDGVHGRELWRSDGTEVGTTLVKDINPAGDAFAVVLDLGWVADGNRFFLAADDGVHGNELWVSDGTLAGTNLVLDILPGPGSSMFSFDGAMAGSFLMFNAEDGQGFGNELWRSDGTAGGSMRLVDVNPNGSSFATNFTSFGGRVYFIAAGGNALGQELFVTDGSFSGTSLFLDADVGPGSGFSFTSGKFFEEASGLLFIRVTGGPNAGLWSTDGVTSAFISSAISGGEVGIELGGLLYFVGDNPVLNDLFVSDGSVLGTGPVTTTNLNPLLIGVSQGELWFSTEGANGREPYRTDGSVDGEIAVADLATQSPLSSSPLAMTPFGSETLFAADAEEDGLWELWKTDGTAAGTEQLSSVILQPDPLALIDFSAPQIHPKGDVAYFAATLAGSGEELWVTDGTIGGTSLLLDIHPGGASSGPFGFADLGAITLFAANDGSGHEPWRTDGTSIGTFRLADLIAGPGQSIITPSIAPEPFAAVNSGVAVFCATDPVLGAKLHKTDGTVAGTTVLLDSTGTETECSSGFEVWGGKAYFAGDSASTGLELFVTDGTEAGTALVVDLQPASNADSSPRSFASSSTALYFVATDPVRGAEVYTSDGSAGGTIRLTDLASAPVGLTVVGETLYFFSNEAEGDLWTSDGTVLGTAAVGDFNDGGDFFAPDFLADTNPISINGRLVFPGNDGVRGREPWVSDGTLMGTVPLANFGETTPGVEGDSEPSDFARLPDGRLVFSADSLVTGRELWAVAVPESGFLTGLGIGAAALLVRRGRRRFDR